MNRESTRSVKEFASIVNRKDGRVTKVRVPGHSGRVYMVTISRNGDLRAYCNLVRGGDGSATYRACKGNRHSVCYHVLAAIEIAAEDQGFSTHGWTHEEGEAKRLSNLHNGSTVVTLESAQSGTQRFLVISTDQDDIENPKSYLQRGKWDNLESWAEKAEELSGWYDADLARGLSTHGVETPAQKNKLQQLMEKYPGQRLLQELA